MNKKERIEELKLEIKDKRIKELEQMAFKSLTGEEISQFLSAINPKLSKEYDKLMDF